MRKRKQYEYKLQKRTKCKEDFLEYIQYECNLLKLLEIRRENTGYHHKQAEIEGAIKNRQKDISITFFLYSNSGHSVFSFEYDSTPVPNTQKAGY